MNEVPNITTWGDNGAALSYAEMDANLEALRDFLGEYIEPVAQLEHGLVQGNLVHLNPALGTWTKSRANLVQNCATAIVTHVQDINNFVVIRSGVAQIPGHGLGVGLPVYTSASTPGLMTTTAPSGLIQLVGWVKDADHIFIRIGSPTVTPVELPQANSSEALGGANVSKYMNPSKTKAAINSAVTSAINALPTIPVNNILACGYFTVTDITNPAGPTVSNVFLQGCTMGAVSVHASAGGWTWMFNINLNKRHPNGSAHFGVITQSQYSGSTHLHPQYRSPSYFQLRAVGLTGSVAGDLISFIVLNSGG